MTMIGLLLSTFVSRADRPVTADAVDTGPAIRIEIGEVNVRDTDNRFTVRDLDLSHCVARPQAASTPPPRAPAEPDRILLDVVVRHHHTEHVTISAIDPGYAWVGPCVERELFTQHWPIRDGRLEVPLTVMRPVEREPEPAILVVPAPPR
jgi:hypothetical protein